MENLALFALSYCLLRTKYNVLDIKIIPFIRYTLLYINKYYGKKFIDS